MTPNEYQKLAMTTLNPALSNEEVLCNGVMGLCGEAGEAIDLVKKHLYHGHPLDREALIKELGDIAWYLVLAAISYHFMEKYDSLLLNTVVIAFFVSYVLHRDLPPSSLPVIGKYFKASPSPSEGGEKD